MTDAAAPHAFAPAAAPIALIRALEERAFNAWPAHQTLFHRGWVFRLSGGYTKRANSVNALVPGAPFDGVREAATAMYARHGLPTVFRLSPLAPPEVDKELADAGYQHFDPSVVLHRPLTGLAKPDGSTTVMPTASDAWLDGFAAANAVALHHRALHRTVVQAIAHPTAFAVQHAQGQAVGFGLAVLERGVVGLSDLAVAPQHRGLGRGQALVEALLHWAADAGAHRPTCRCGRRTRLRCACKRAWDSGPRTATTTGCRLSLQAPSRRCGVVPIIYSPCYGA